MIRRAFPAQSVPLVEIGLNDLPGGTMVRFGKLGKTQGKPYCNSKTMGIHFPQPIFMSIFEKKLNFLAT